jgi:hypothetical protein
MQHFERPGFLWQFQEIAGRQRTSQRLAKAKGIMPHFPRVEGFQGSLGVVLGFRQ